MPLTVCPHCVYYKLKNSLCISGLNVISKRFAKSGGANKLGNRAKGVFCFNNMYIFALIIPILVTIPALIINYSVLLLILFISLVVLLMFRFFILFVKIACLHCRAKFTCPQAGQMGVRER